MFAGKLERPYFEAWLKRTRRLLAPSGRLTEAALILSREEGGSQDSWRKRLRDLLDGVEMPDFELVTRIDRLLAGSGARVIAVEPQVMLF